jgi:hypothetical protein
MSYLNTDNIPSKIYAVVDQWITDHMGKGKGDVVNVDITTEMKKATIWSIGKTLFGYDFLAEETE